MNRLLDAVGIAIAYHGDQKYGHLPYIAHPVAVADQVSQRGGNEAQVVAAILHDTVEDTDLTIEQVEMMFGTEVAFIVGAMTHAPLEPYEDYIDALPDEAVLVKLCDSICNLAGLPSAEMTHHRRTRLTARYERTITVLSERLRRMREG